MPRARADSRLSPRLRRRGLAEARETPPRPAAQGLQRGSVARFRLCPASGASSGFRPRHNTVPHTRKDV
jgi:hypothetical protein